jgi:TolB protein
MSLRLAMVNVVLLTAASTTTGAATSDASRCAPELVASGADENHVFFHGLSPDNKTLAVGWDMGTGADMRRGAYLLDLRARRRTELPRLNNAPSYSPDGRFLVSANYTPNAKTELVELDLRSGEASTLASDPAWEWLGSYSADGQWVLFNSTRAGGSDLYRIRRSDGLIERLTDDPRYDAHGQFFDDDRRIVFHRQIERDDYDLMVLDLRTRAIRAVGSTPAEEAYPAASRDGRWIAFSGVPGPGRQPNLFVIGLDGSGRRQLTDGASKDAYATWSRDGAWLYFVRFEPQGSGIYRIPMRQGRCDPG